MKKCRPRFLVFLLAAIAAFLSIPREDATILAMRFAAASASFSKVIKAPVDEPVSFVDVKMTLHTNPFGGSQRRSDDRASQVRLDAHVTRRFDATPTTPAHDEILRTSTAFFEARQLVAFSVPGNRGETRIEFNIAPVPR